MDAANLFLAIVFQVVFFPLLSLRLPITIGFLLYSAAPETELVNAAGLGFQ